MESLLLVIWTITSVGGHYITSAGATMLETCKITSINNEFMDCNLNSLSCHNATLEDLKSDLKSVNLHKLNCLSVTEGIFENLDEDIFIEATSLKYLDLQENSLEDLHYNLFNNLKDLEYLDLRYNKLTDLSDSRLFISQNKLKILKLSFNKIRFVDVKVLAPLRSISEIHISENSLICDCKTYWTMIWWERKDFKGYVLCDAPINLKGLAWTVLRKIESCSNNSTSEESLTDLANLIPKDLEKSNSVISKGIIFYIILIVIMVMLTIFFIAMLIYLRKWIIKKHITPVVECNARSSAVFVLTEKNEQSATPDRWRESSPYDNIGVCNISRPKVGSVYVVKDGEVTTEEPSLSGVSSDKILNPSSQQVKSDKSENDELNSKYLGFQNELYNAMNVRM